MKAVSGRVAVGGALGLGLLCLLVPGTMWVRVATAFSPDGRIGDPSVARLVSHTGHVLAVLSALVVAGRLGRAHLRSGLTWACTCPPIQWCGLLAVVVIVPRAAWMAVTETTPHVDLAWYHTHAQHLAAGLGYLENGRPTAFWPVGYPLFLAGLYRIVGPSLAAVRIVHTVIGVLTAILLWRLGRRFLSESTARLSAIVYALCPSTIMFAELPSTETLFACLLVGLWVLVLSPDLPAGRRRVCLGLLVGAGVLVKPVLQPWPALALLLVSWPHLRRGLLDCIVVYVVALCVIAPWTARNYRAFGRFVPVSTNAGFNLYVGNARGATGAVRTLPAEDWAPYYAMPNEAERDAALRAAAVADMRAEPGRIIRLVPAKLAALFRDDSAALRWAGSAPGAQWSAARALLTRLTLDGFYYACLLLTALWAVRRRWRSTAGDSETGGDDTGDATVTRPSRARAWAVLWSWAAYIVVVHAVYYGDPRYHHVLWPLLALATAAALGQFARPPVTVQRQRS